jgi:glutamyl endopeptidase
MAKKFKDENDTELKELRKLAPPDAWLVKDETGVWLEAPKKMSATEAAKSYVADDGSIIYPGEKPTAPPLNPEPYPTITPFSIIGNDELVRQNPTTIYPYSAITYLIPAWNGSSGNCTGFVIGPHTIATAGHCLYDHEDGLGYADTVYVAPAKNLSSTPYGVYYAAKIAVLNGFAFDRDYELDYGVVQLNQNISQMTGTISLRMVSGSMNDMGTNITGYPWNPAKYLDSGMYRHVDKVWLTYPNYILYANDTEVGMSGSPIINDSASCNMCAIGIHTQGYGPANWSSSLNGGIRMTQTVVNNLNA